MVSSRDRICQRRDDHVDRRQDAAACVSLSKSTMSKTRTALAAPPFSARCRRRRLSSRPVFSCQPNLWSFFPEPPLGGDKEKKSSRPPEGLPSKGPDWFDWAAESNRSSSKMQGRSATSSFRNAKPLPTASRPFPGSRRGISPSTGVASLFL